MLALSEEFHKTRFNKMSFDNGELEDIEDAVKEEESV
jgi:hypothetical protein